MHPSSALLLIQSIVLMLMTQHSTAQVNYTCLASAAISTSSSQAAAVGSCLNNANGALTATSIKACIKSTKTKDKTAKKPQALFYKCLNAYWKAATALAKTNSSISAATASCLASTGSYDSCKLATIVGASNAKLAKKATKADAKWTGKKCAGILTPAGCSVVSAASTTASTAKNDSTTALTTTTTVTGMTTTTPATTATTTAGTTTTTAPVPCSIEYCQVKCLMPTCNSTIEPQATDSLNATLEGSYYGPQLNCSSNTTLPTPTPLDDGTLSISFNFDTFCGSTYVHGDYDTSMGWEGTANFTVNATSLSVILTCKPGTGVQSWATGDLGNFTDFYCLS